MARITTDTLDLIQKGAQEVITLVPPDFEDQATMLFGKMGNDGQKTVQVRTTTGFGAGTQTPEDDNIVYDTRKKVYTQNITLPKWVVAFQKSIETSLFDFYGEHAKDMALARDAMLETKQIQLAAIFNEGFTDNNEGPDGGALFSTTVGAGSGNPTYASKPTTDIALDPDAVAQELSGMRQVLDPRNFARRFRGNVKLVVPNELEFDALTIANSTLKSGTAENDANVIAKRITPHVMDYLTDATAWFLVAENPSMHGLKLLTGPGMDTWTERNIDNLGVKTAIFEFFKPFWVHSYGVRGINP